MPELEVFITNRDRTIHRRMFQYEGLQVTIPLNGARECRFTCPIYDINALGQSNIAHFTPLRRFVKVFYRGYLIFYGPIVKPIFNLAENQVEVNCHDPSIWLKNHFLHADDEAVTASPWPVDGNALVALLDAARLNADELADGIAELPIFEGTISIPDPAVRDITFEEGQNVWDAWMDIVEGIDGPDFRLLPDDSGPDEVCGLDTFGAGQMGTDRTAEVQFHFGFGRTNLGNFTYEPDGAVVRNRYVAERFDGLSFQVAKYLDGMQADGIMEGWEQQSESIKSDEGLAETAKGFVKVYGVVPQVFTIEPTWDMGLLGSAAATPWRYPSGFREGDFIRGVARKGNFEMNLTGRVTKVTVNQLNAAENVATQVEIIPEEVLTAGVTVGPTP